MKSSTVKESNLGETTIYPTAYDPSLLFAIPRNENRIGIGLNDSSLPFYGIDQWTAFEVSWLDLKGKPQVAVADWSLPHDTPNLIESKSIKLYLNSFNETKVQSIQKVKETIRNDLSQFAGGPVQVRLTPASDWGHVHATSFEGNCIDDLPVTIDTYQVQPSFLKAEGENVEETLVSNLLKSNCPVTLQPDWASVQIRYQGPKIDHEGLLKYLVSFRRHDEFHECCVERIFTDIHRICKPEKLTVYARYTRRGGLDINPFRSNFENPPENNLRLFRQ